MIPFFNKKDKQDKNRFLFLNFFKIQTFFHKCFLKKISRHEKIKSWTET